MPFFQNNQDAKNLDPHIKEVFCDAVRKFESRASEFCNLEYIIEESFLELNPGIDFLPNWHIEAIAKTLELVAKGELKRVVICMPPRYLKSHCVNVAFSLWLLGRYPHKKIISASYNQQLSNNFLNQVKRVMQSDWYKRLFPDTKITKNTGLKNKICTEQKGFRFATSINGTLTGEGADILIADDPQKPVDIVSKRSRERVQEWFRGSFMSRLNSKKNGAVVVVMQRLHCDDLVGHIIERDKRKEWFVLNLELVTPEEREIIIKNKNYYHYKRPAGHILHEARDGIEEIEALKYDVGEDIFMAQYQQNPQSQDGTVIKKSWIKPYEEPEVQVPKSEKEYFISIDAAVKAGASNDYTAISIWYRFKDPDPEALKKHLALKRQEAIKNNIFYEDEAEKIGKWSKAGAEAVTRLGLGGILSELKVPQFSLNPSNQDLFLEEVINQKLSYPQIVCLVCELIAKYGPLAVIIEDAASGAQLIQHLQHAVRVPVFGRVPTSSKQLRLTFASYFFEKGRININAAMHEYKNVVHQLTQFPSVKHDDICDSVSMFVNWFYEFYADENKKRSLANKTGEIRGL